MAIKNIDFQKVNLNEGKLVQLTAATAAADGFAIDFCTKMQVTTGCCSICLSTEKNHDKDYLEWHQYILAQPVQ